MASRKTNHLTGKATIWTGPGAQGDVPSRENQPM